MAKSSIARQAIAQLSAERGLYAAGLSNRSIRAHREGGGMPEGVSRSHLTGHRCRSGRGFQLAKLRPGAEVSNHFP